MTDIEFRPFTEAVEVRSAEGRGSCFTIVANAAW